MCLVAFQKIFRKIFSGVWKRRRKTQIQKNTSHNPEKTQTQFKFFLSDLSPAQSRCREIAINGAISRRRDHDRRIFLSDLAIFLDGSSSRISRRRDLAKARSRSTARSRRREIAINSTISRRRDCDQRCDLATARSHSSLLLSRTRALSLSLIFRKCFEGKIEV